MADEKQRTFSKRQLLRERQLPKDEPGSIAREQHMRHREERILDIIESLLENEDIEKRAVGEVLFHLHIENSRMRLEIDELQKAQAMKDVKSVPGPYEVQ